VSKTTTVESDFEISFDAVSCLPLNDSDDDDVNAEEDTCASLASKPTLASGIVGNVCDTFVDNEVNNGIGNDNDDDIDAGKGARCG
jgi:hypothetical protein